MFFMGFLVGLLCGLAAIMFRSSLDGIVLRLRYPLGADERYLLCAARATGGRLILKTEEPGVAPAVILIRDLPGHRYLQRRDQLERLLKRGLLAPDPSGIPGRFMLTPPGWAVIKKLPPLPMEGNSRGSWFNSVSRKAVRSRSGLGGIKKN